MYDLMAKELNISKEAIVNQQTFWNECIKELHWIIPFSVKAFYRKRVCASSFHLRKNGTYSILAGDFNVGTYRKSKLKKIRLVYHMIKSYGLTYIFQNICLLFKLPFKFEDPHNMLVVLRSWPNLLNIDSSTAPENKVAKQLVFHTGGQIGVMVVGNTRVQDDQGFLGREAAISQSRLEFQRQEAPGISPFEVGYYLMSQINHAQSQGEAFGRRLKLDSNIESPPEGPL